MISCSESWSCSIHLICRDVGRFLKQSCRRVPLLELQIKSTSLVLLSLTVAKEHAHYDVDVAEKGQRKSRPITISANPVNVIMGMQLHVQIKPPNWKQTLSQYIIHIHVTERSKSMQVGRTMASNFAMLEHCIHCGTLRLEGQLYIPV